MFYDILGRAKKFLLGSFELYIFNVYIYIYNFNSRDSKYGTPQRRQFIYSCNCNRFRYWSFRVIFHLILVMQLPRNIRIKMVKFAYKFLIHVMEVMIKKLQLLYFLIMMDNLWILVQMPYKNMHKLLRINNQLCSSRMY